MMEPAKNYEEIGRFIYGAGRVNTSLATMMQTMGKPMLAGERTVLAANALEADAMFARLPASDGDKAQFSSLMQSLAALGGQLDLLDRLSDGDFASCAAGIAAAQDALPRFDAIVDGLYA